MIINQYKQKVGDSDKAVFKTFSDPAPAVNTDEVDKIDILAQEGDINFSTNLTGNPANFDLLRIRLKLKGDVVFSDMNLPASRDWYSVTYGDGKFVAVAYNSGNAAYSTDGINWTESTMPASRYWYSVTYGDGKFVAVASSSGNGGYTLSSTLAVLLFGDKFSGAGVNGSGFIDVAQNQIAYYFMYNDNTNKWEYIELPHLF